ncbi:MAG: hypothetical protein WCG20_01550 [bacterium]
MKSKPSSKQRQYAYNLLNSNQTKQQSALMAGYSESMARVPAQIEQSKGFHLAMAIIAGYTENVAMQILHELQARDISKEDTKNLFYGIDVLSKAWERFMSK